MTDLKTTMDGSGPPSIPIGARRTAAFARMEIEPAVRHAIGVSIAVMRGICVAVGRPIHARLLYRRPLREFDGLTATDLRELKFGRGDIPDIAWEEALRGADAAGKAALVGAVAIGIAAAAVAALIVLAR